MSLKIKLDQDLKQAILSGDQLKKDTLRTVKSVILNEEISHNKRDEGLSDDEIIYCLKKEVKKRQEASELYEKAGSTERAEKELVEKRIIEEYLPDTMEESEIDKLIDQAVGKYGAITQQTMGVVIGEVKKNSHGNADGSVVARLVKARIN